MSNYGYANIGGFLNQLDAIGNNITPQTVAQPPLFQRIIDGQTPSQAMAPQNNAGNNAPVAGALIDPQYDPQGKSAGMQPAFADKLQDTMQDLTEDYGLPATLNSGYRSNAQQTALYNQGRFGNPGNIVTKAPAGSSFHNWGAAGDIGIPNENNIANQQMVRAAAENLGLTSGASFRNFPDPLHVQAAGTLAQARDAFNQMNQTGVANNQQY